MSLKINNDSFIIKDICNTISLEDDIDFRNSNKLKINNKKISSSSVDETRTIKQSIIKNDKDKSNLIYGNSLDNLKPFRMGKTFTFIYFYGSPLIVIGPDCKNNSYIILIS